MTGGTADISVVIPTIGRPALLRACLTSVASCAPRAAEVVVVDQSGGDEVDAIVEEFTGAGARRVESGRRGIALGANTGLREASYERVAITHDDCTVDASWAGMAARLIDEHPDEIVTGRVVPHGGDEREVPGSCDRPEPRLFRARRDFWYLRPNNMVVRRAPFLEFGAFDERFERAAEDLDVAYRWIMAGRAIRYEPGLRVTHHHWRTPEQVRETYRVYARGTGMFYAKHLLHGDGLMARAIAGDTLSGLRGRRDALRGSDETWCDDRMGVFPGLYLGLADGVRRFLRA
jgi:GT2 family glycosyltransferase